MAEHEHNHCEGCDNCGHAEHEESSINKYTMLAAAALVIISFIPFPEWLKIALQIIAVILAAYPVVISAFNNIRHKKFTETELMVIACTAACCLGDFREAAAVMILYRLGEMLEDKAVASSRKSLDEILKIRQDTAHILLDDGTVKDVSADSVEIGTKIAVLPYERFPIDGVVYSGNSTADAAAITGESMPVNIGKGSTVKSGMINGMNSVKVVTSEYFKDSTASKIVQMVEEASENKGKTRKLITRIAKFYTPIVVILAVLIAIVGSIASGQPSEWIYRALIFLVASCPCAIVISVPLGFYTGIGAAAKKGIITKGSVFIEAVAKAKTVIFDKTGTLTTGKLEVSEVTPTANIPKEAVLLLAAAAEHFSAHPIAKTITESAPEIDESLISDFSEIAGAGASAVFAGKKVLCGSRKFLSDNGVDTNGLPENQICVALEQKAVGSITLRSTVRNGADEIVQKLKQQGIEKAFMLTGDNESAAKDIAETCNIDEYYCNLLPDEKLKLVSEIQKRYGKVIYVGDGINDAPVLAQADAGVAMGLGTQAANEAADIIITNDKIEKLAPAHKIFKRTMNIVKFNIIFALAVKLIVLILGVFGVAPIWLAVFSDVGVCLICILLTALIKSKKNILFDK